MKFLISNSVIGLSAVMLIAVIGCMARMVWSLCVKNAEPWPRRASSGIWLMPLLAVLLFYNPIVNWAIHEKVVLNLQIRNMERGEGLSVSEFTRIYGMGTLSPDDSKEDGLFGYRSSDWVFPFRESDVMVWYKDGVVQEVIEMD